MPLGGIKTEMESERERERKTVRLLEGAYNMMREAAK